jgi:hypothetical protein
VLPEEQISVVVNTVIVNQLRQLGESVSEDVEAQLESKLTDWREGRSGEAADWIRNLRGDPTKWSVLTSKVKARVLCFEGRMALSLHHDIETAKQLADEAEELFPVVELPRLRAMITYTEEGPEAAIESLEGQDDVNSLNLKAAFLLELGRTTDVLDVLASNDNGSEKNDEN